MRSRRAQVLAAVSLTIAAPAAARAQSLERFSIESVVAIDQFAGERAVNRPNITIDITAAVRLGSGWQIYVRPWFRQPRAPDWDRQIYQAAVRYEHQGRVAARVDAGYIASPVGLGVMDASAATNPTIAPHLSYFAPMLPFLTDGARVNAVASTYPLGAQVTFSTDRWDARGALVASTPTRIFVIGGGANPQATPVVEAGAGVTPKTGVRVGVSMAHGAYLTAGERAPAGGGSRAMTMIGVEGEYAFGYTKLTGEFLHDAFETPEGTAAAYEWFVQGMQTLSPRWFVAARHEGTSSPVRGVGGPLAAQPRLAIVEATAGFRVTPEITIRGSYLAREFYGRTSWDRQGGAQLVWARRWW